MFLAELQEAPDGPMDTVERTIESITRQWKAGKTKDISYHSQMALMYSIMKKANECREHAAFVPDSASEDDRLNVYVSLARMLIYEKKIEEAMHFYNKSLELCPDHEMALEEIAGCHFELKQFAEAEKYFREAVAQTPTAYHLWEGVGMAASQQEKYEDAITCFTKAIELDEHKYNLHYYEYCIGLCYANLKDFYRGLAHYLKSLDANPSFAQSLNNIATLYYEHEADIKTAITYLKRAEEIAEAENDENLLQLVYINLQRLYTLIAEYDLKDYYHSKLMNALGFGAFLNFDEDEDE